MVTSTDTTTAVSSINGARPIEVAYLPSRCILFEVCMDQSAHGPSQAGSGNKIIKMGRAQSST